MEAYSFKSFVLKDKVIFIFFLFFFSNAVTYSTVLLFTTTLIPLRTFFMAILLGLFIRDETNFNGINKINNRLLSVFIFFYTISFITNITNSDSLFFFSTIASLLVSTLFVNYLNRHYNVHAIQILTDIFLYSLLYIPIILLANPSYIHLNLYANNNIEELGIKSRYLGWSCCLLYGILLFQSSFSRLILWKKIFLFLLVFFVIISGSRSALLSVCATTLLYFLHQKHRFRYLIVSSLSVLFVLIMFSDQISSYAKLVSFQIRVEAKESGFSDDTYRQTVLVDAIKISRNNIGNFIFGFGPGTFKETLRQYNIKYSDNELSSHNTYLEVFMTGGFLSFIVFIFLFVLKPLKSFYYNRKEILYFFVPIIIISVTENNFGIGQYLFVTFSLVAFYSFKL